MDIEDWHTTLGNETNHDHMVIRQPNKPNTSYAREGLARGDNIPPSPSNTLMIGETKVWEIVQEPTM